MTGTNPVSDAVSRSVDKKRQEKAPVTMRATVVKPPFTAGDKVKLLDGSKAYLAGARSAEVIGFSSNLVTVICDNDWIGKVKPDQVAHA